MAGYWGRALLGGVSIGVLALASPAAAQTGDAARDARIQALQAQLDGGRVRPEDPLSRAMTRFKRGRRAGGQPYRVITLDTPLEVLEAFFEGVDHAGQPQEFAVVTDEDRRFVLGVATRADLEEFGAKLLGVEIAGGKLLVPPVVDATVLGHLLTMHGVRFDGATLDEAKAYAKAHPEDPATADSVLDALTMKNAYALHDALHEKGDLASWPQPHWHRDRAPR